MTYRIIISTSAFKDLENIKSFIALDNFDNAKKYVERILDRLKLLSEFPYCGIKIKNPFFNYTDINYLICSNHVAVYQINEMCKCVHVLRVFSRFQDWRNVMNKGLIKQNETIISDERIDIVKMNRSMYYDVYRNSLDEDNRRFVPDEVFETLEEASEVVNQIIECYDSEDGPFIYAVIRKEDQANLGYVQLVKIEEGWEIGYHIAKVFTGHGYATEAVTLFLEYLKKNTRINEVFGIALASNKASRRVLEKSGFTFFFEGNGIYQGKRRKIIKTIKHLDKE